MAGARTTTSDEVQLTVDPRELATSYQVEYGTTTAYGQTTTPATVVNTEGEQSETVSITGLEPCTTYHYQAEAESEANEGEASVGGDQTFKTGGCLLGEGTATFRFFQVFGKTEESASGGELELKQGAFEGAAEIGRHGEGGEPGHAEVRFEVAEVSEPLSAETESIVFEYVSGSKRIGIAGASGNRFIETVPSEGGSLVAQAELPLTATWRWKAYGP